MTPDRLGAESEAAHHGQALVPFPPEPSEKKPRVLVVDDEQSVTLLCTYVLGDAGYEVETASSAPAAIELITQRRYDAFLIDLVMPGGGGLQVIREARRASPTTPLVVMTAEPRHLVPPRAGMDYYLHKPFDGLLALEDVVATAVRQGARATDGAGVSRTR